MSKAIIIGAGIGGSTLALMLKRFTKIQPLLYERAPSFTHIGAGLTLAPNALRSLHQLGLMQKLRAISQQVNGINLYSNQKQRLVTRIGSDFYKEMYGYPLLAFERAKLQELLISELRENGVEVNFGHRCVSILDDEESATGLVKFENGKEVEGDVIVGADGGHSFLRSFTIPGNSGDGTGERGGGMDQYTGWTTLYGITEPIAQAPTKDQAQLVSDIGRTYGCWPLPGKQQFWAITLNEPFPGLWPEEESLQKSLDGCRDLWFPESYGGNGRFMRSIVEKSVRTIKVPLMSGHWENTNLGRLVLIGDAAHALVPFVGQGACQAIEDAASLTNSLLTLPGALIVAGRVPRHNISLVLDKYTATRRPRVERIVKWGQNTGTISMSENRILKSFMEFVLRFTSSKRIGKSVEWVYGHGPEILVKKSL